MYRDEVGQQIEEHLAAHAALLHRWLDALRQRAAKTEEPGLSQNYRLFEQAMAERTQILCMYDGFRRELCPIILGHSEGEEKALAYQFGGESRSGLPRGGEWRCLFLSNVSNVQLRKGRWYTGDSHGQPSRCVEIVDLDVNPDSPYDPKRRLSALFRAAEKTGSEAKSSSTARPPRLKKTAPRSPRRK